MTVAELRGVLPILSTPFHADGALDLDSLRSLVRFELEAGAHGLTILGIAGEVYKLLDAERDVVTEVVMEEVAGRVPVVVGAGHPGGTRASVELCQRAEQAGAAAVMVAPPFISKPSAEQARDCYGSIADAISIPIVVQDEPVATGFSMSPAWLAALAREIPACRYAKIEHVPTASKMAAIAEQAADNRLGLFGGTFGLYFLEELERGARGIMTGFAYPEVLVEIFEKYDAGDHAGAADTFYRWLPLIQLEAQTGLGLGIRKHLLAQRGAMRSEAVRQPGQPLDPATRAHVASVLERCQQG
jgi:4-hydroxy-tetrahydrodipicolinate synthase